MTAKKLERGTEIITALVMALVVAWALSGCSAVKENFPALGNGKFDPPDVEQTLAGLHNLTVEDVDAAAADAAAHNDVDAVNCWQALQTYLKTNRTADRFEIKGAASSYQKARDLRRKIDGGVSSELKRGCAPMVLDSTAFILRMAALAGSQGAIRLPALPSAPMMLK